jgi:hypothetical protein
VATTITPTPGAKSDTASSAPSRGRDARRRFPWRPWLRALHRDAGYLAVGLTLVYASSGIAVNHIADWDPNFQNYGTSYELGAPLSGDDDAIAQTVMRKLGIHEKPTEVYRRAPDELDVIFEHRSLFVATTTGHIGEEGQKARFLLRVANWLHLNRGKKAWKYAADSYALFLTFLALSGMFMIAGKKGLFGRGAVFVGIGIAIPVLYVMLSGGP